jgi:hypothetical protein
MKGIESAWMLGAVALLGVTSGGAWAAGVHVRQALRATDVTPAARGQAVLRINRRAHGWLRLEVRNLGPDDTFDVSVGGIPIGTVTTNAAGNGRTRFSTQPGAHEQLLGTDPRGKRATVSDHAGEDRLTGSIPGDSLDPTAVRCCVAGSDRVECEAVQPAECQARGGTDLGAGSCLPDPCPGSTPPAAGDVRCCRPDGEHAECERASASDCSVAGGTNVGPGACDPDPCVLPPSDVVRCCVAHDHEAECEHMTADHCTAAGGRSAGPGACDPDPCASSAGGAFVGEGASSR